MSSILEFLFEGCRYVIFPCTLLLLADFFGLIHLRNLHMSARFLSTHYSIVLVLILVPVVCMTVVHLKINYGNRWHAPKFFKSFDDIVHSMCALLNGSDMCLNKRQCLHLSSKLSETVQNIHELVKQSKCSPDDFVPALEYLYRILVKAELLVNRCNKENWIAESVFQIQNESAFKVILLDVGVCYHAIYEQAKLSMGSEWNIMELEDLRDSSTFKPALMEDVIADREELKKRLEDLVNPENYSSRWWTRVYFFVQIRLSKQLRLAEYLVLRLLFIAQQPLSDSSNLPKELFWTEESFPLLTWGREVMLAAGSGADRVCKTRWLSILCAKKCNVRSRHFLTEAGILSRAHHPNIIKFICGGKETAKSGYFITMEKMEMSLFELIKEHEMKEIRFSNYVAVDIMIQIARGLCYLHDSGVAHRDLKPANVVLNVLTSGLAEDYYDVKVVDFGTSKAGVDPFKTASTLHGFGTYSHKAPEVLHIVPSSYEGKRKWKGVWFKVDVWSFGIICLETLTCRLGRPSDEALKDVKSVVPPDCPKELIALLEECLLQEDLKEGRKAYHRRPDFRNIYLRLELLRHKLLRQSFRSDQVSQSELTTDPAICKFIKMGLDEHFPRQNDGIIDGNEVKVLTPQALHVEEGDFEEEIRTDNASDSESSTEMGKEDLEIWIKQPGNEEINNALEEWQEKRAMFAEKSRMKRKQTTSLAVQMVFIYQFHFACSFIVIAAVGNESKYLNMRHVRTVSLILMFLVSVVTICGIIYEHQCFWRLWEALSSDENDCKAYDIQIAILDKKRERFSFAYDAKEYIWASKPSPKQTKLIFGAVLGVSGMLVMSYFSLVCLAFEEIC